MPRKNATPRRKNTDPTPARKDTPPPAIRKGTTPTETPATPTTEHLAAVKERRNR